jgi:hypothetical protein
MSSIRLAACAALATAALVVPATASAKDEAATAAAIGTQPAASTAPATLSAQLALLQPQRLNALPQAVAKLAQETSTLNQQVKDASARGDVLTVQKLTEQSQLNMLRAQGLMSKQNAALDQIKNVSAELAEALRAKEAAAKAAAAGAQPAGASSMGKDEASTAAAIGTQPAASTASATVPALIVALQTQRENALPQKLATLQQETVTVNQQIKDAHRARRHAHRAEADRAVPTEHDRPAAAAPAEQSAG